MDSLQGSDEGHEATRDASTLGRSERAINVVVPEAAYWRAKDAAGASRMSFKAFITRLLLEAKPFSPAVK